MKSKEYKYSKCFFQVPGLLPETFTTPKGEVEGGHKAFSFGPDRFISGNKNALDEIIGS